MRGSALHVNNKQYFVYIVADSRPTLYVGVTNNLLRRVYEHRQGLVEGFTKQYCLHKLIYYEIFNDVSHAIEREKQIKHWNRSWKLNLIKKLNPTFSDLYDTLI